MRRVENVEPVVPKLRRSTSGASDEPPMPHTTAWSNSSYSVSAKPRMLLDPLLDAERLIEPPEPLRLVARPSRSVASRSQIPSIRARGHRYARQGLALARTPSRARGTSRRTSARPPPRAPGDVVVVDADRRSSSSSSLASSSPARARVDAHLAVVLEGLDRLLRHRVHRVRADQLLDVEDVAVRGVLGRGGGPQAALRQRALRLERLPARAREEPPGSAGTRASRSRSRACRAARAPPRSRSPRAACRPRCRRARRRSSRPSAPSTGRRRPRRAARDRGGRPRSPRCAAPARRSA